MIDRDIWIVLCVMRYILVGRECMGNWWMHRLKCFVWHSTSSTLAPPLIWREAYGWGSVVGGMGEKWHIFQHYRKVIQSCWKENIHFVCIHGFRKILITIFDKDNFIPISWLTKKINYFLCSLLSEKNIFLFSFINKFWLLLFDLMRLFKISFI